MWKHKVIWVTLSILIVGAYILAKSPQGLFSKAKTTTNVIDIIQDSLSIGQVTVDEVIAFVSDNDLNCIENENTRYDPNFSEQEYDSLIVCWEPAPNANTPSSGFIGDLVNISLCNWVFRIVFLFKGDFLVDLSVFLDDRCP